MSVSLTPLVLLSAVDHHHRIGHGNKKRAVGVLLGSVSTVKTNSNTKNNNNNNNNNTTTNNTTNSTDNNTATTTAAAVSAASNTHNNVKIKVSNSFAIPFEEDTNASSTDPVWFIDHNYIESMADMFKKINARERIVGWYHTGTKLTASDSRISDLFAKYIPKPLLVIINTGNNPINSDDINNLNNNSNTNTVSDDSLISSELPIDAYLAIEDPLANNTTDNNNNSNSNNSRTFVHIAASIEADEAEEIGVEHLLRDIRNVGAIGNLPSRLTYQLSSLRGLQSRLEDIILYIDNVINKKMPINHEILGKIQNVFNLLPNLSTSTTIQDNNNSNSVNTITNTTPILESSIVEGDSPLASAFRSKTYDKLMFIYVSSLIRSIIAFHDLIENKIENKKLASQANKLLPQEVKN